MVHLHNDHGPHARKRALTRVSNSKENDCTLYSFALVVCRHPVTGHFLLVQEFCNQGFWLPGGRVDAGESLTSAAIRETKEEAGVDIELKGILALEHKPYKSRHGYYVRMRLIFYAEPVDLNSVPKSRADFESAGAAWCSVQDIDNKDLRLRGTEPLIWSKYLESGGCIYPMSLLNEKGA
jgi:8-oxo-dGTP pyrophosphatase MutT (NUDIX family)